MEWDLWFSFPFFFIVNFSFWSRYWEGVLKAATLLGPGGSILGLEPVKSELRGGGGGKERFRFQGNSRVATLRALPPQGWGRGRRKEPGFSLAQPLNNQVTLSSC